MRAHGRHVRLPATEIFCDGCSRVYYSCSTERLILETTPIFFATYARSRYPSWEDLGKIPFSPLGKMASEVPGRVDENTGIHNGTHNHVRDNHFTNGATCQNCVLDEDAIAFCKECKRLLCEECLSFHRRQVDTSKHEIEESPDAEKLKKVYLCDKHGDKALDYFCKDCKIPICHHCYMAAGCREHEVMVSTSVREEISALLDRVKENKTRFIHHAEHIESVIGRNADALVQCEAQVEREFDRMIHELKERKTKILTFLKEETEKNDQKIKEEKDFVKQKLDGMTKKISDAEVLLKTKKEAKLMVNRVSMNSDLAMEASHAWEVENATLRSWQLDHEKQEDHAKKFSSLIPKPKKTDIKVVGLTEARVGVENVFKVKVDIIDQFKAYDNAVINGFLSVKITFKPTSNRTASVLPRTIDRDPTSNVWTVTYFLRQQGRVSVSVSVCGVEPENQPWTSNTDPKKKEIKVNDRVVRGIDWKWDNQDGGMGNKGTVVYVKDQWVNVKWDNSKKPLDYRWGNQDCYDLKVVSE